MKDERARKQEEHHFYKRDQELIEKMRAKADAERREKERHHRKQLHWMKCPKCGHEMEEVAMGDVRVDKCKECSGIYLDAGELEILLAGEKDSSVFRRLFGR